MQIDFQGTGLQAVRRPPGADWQRMMWINADRVLYLGLLGEPTVRCFGGFSVYLSLRGTHRICVDGGDWQDSAVSVVPPYVRHRIVSGERMICNLLVEAETVDLAALPPHLRVGRGAVDAPAALQRMREALDILGRADNRRYASTAAFDEAFFGAPLRTRALDARVLAVLDRIKSDPNGHVSAQECAAAAHLSVSRSCICSRPRPARRFAAFAPGNARAACCTT